MMLWILGLWKRPLYNSTYINHCYVARNKQRGSLREFGVLVGLRLRKTLLQSIEVRHGRLPLAETFIKRAYLRPHRAFCTLEHSGRDLAQIGNSNHFPLPIQSRSPVSQGQACRFLQSNGYHYLDRHVLVIARGSTVPKSILFLRGARVGTLPFGSHKGERNRGTKALTPVPHYHPSSVVRDATSQALEADCRAIG